MRVAVLGPITVESDEGEIALTPQLRRLLGVLVVADGGPVSADRLQEFVFDGPVESSALRTAVSRLRKVLGERVTADLGAYRLSLTADELDAARFEQLVSRAKSAPPEARIASLTKAVELWSGPALGDLGDAEWASSWATRMDGLRATAIEDLGEALLTVGRQRDSVEVLAEHVRSHPYRERPVRLLMQALAADGRIADALREFERFRVTLRDDTGLEPSAALRDVEADLLSTHVERDAPGRALPEGTVTFLFTDIEGSTERWADDESAMTKALAAHDEVLRNTVHARGGVVFKHTGDGMCAVFTSASAAVDAAIDAQAHLQLPVRMGVHTGEAELRGDDYFGPTLNRVARIMDAGHGGQILLSRATMSLVATDDLTDLGEHRLKGLTNGERIWQIGTHQFPGLRTVTALKGNLPVELSGFVGRDHELDELAAHVTSHRLVTLIGVGGTGKTRLAIEAASRLAPTFPDGCWMAELSRVVTADAVAHAVCIGLGLTVPEKGDVTDHIVRRLSRQRLIVVVDNCEHVLEAAAQVVERILAACPAVSILATSLEPLMVAGEQLVPTPSLSIDDAVQLFTDRAGTEAPTLHLDERQQRAVIEICERLDRLPLAIELAVARVRSMSPVDILGRLDERFRLLVGGRRSRMERHQTMRGALDWSYDLCSSNEQHVFDRLSVFVGDFDLDAARAVTSNETSDVFDADDALARLVDRSLVQRVLGADGASRFRLLETMRAYGHEHLVEQGIADDARGAHAAHLAATALALNLRSLGPDEEAVHRQIRALVPDSLVALDWFLERADWYHAERLARACVYAAYGIYLAMVDRIAAAALARDGNFEGFDPIFRVGYETLWANDGTFVALKSTPNDARARILSVISVPCALPPDHGDTPLDWVTGIGYTDDELAVLDAFAEQFREVHPAVYVATLVGYQHSLVELGQHERVISDRPRLERLVEDLDSDTMRRMMLGIWSLAYEGRDDRTTAAELARQSLTFKVEHPTHEDMLNACRYLRNAARIGTPITGDDLRLPITWSQQVGSLWTVNAILHSMALALLSMGHPALAARAMNAIPLDEFKDFLAWLAGLIGGQFRELIEHRTGTERADDVIAAVLALADELDRDTAPSA
jgi:predicted ATPase/class 3 adenylate cyclase